MHLRCTPCPDEVYLPPIEFEAAQTRNAEELTFATVR